MGRYTGNGIIVRRKFREPSDEIHRGNPERNLKEISETCRDYNRPPKA